VFKQVSALMALLATAPGKCSLLEGITGV